MQSINKRRTGRLVVLGLAAALALAYSGVTFAASSPPSSINTCTKVNKHGVYGKTKITAASSCSGKSAFQTWEPQTPAVSVPIIAGNHDADTPFTLRTTIATLTIPTAGSYAVWAKVRIVNAAGALDEDGCALTGPTTANRDESTVYLGPSYQATLPLEIVDTFSSGGTVTLSCSDLLAAGSQDAYNARVIAIGGTSLTNGAL